MREVNILKLVMNPFSPRIFIVSFACDRKEGNKLIQVKTAMDNLCYRIAK